MSFTPSSHFQDAASYLSSASPPSHITSAIKLELYGLFKYLTVSPAPSTPRPSILDITARAKWDVWNLTAKTYRQRAADVESRYLEIAQSLGWVQGDVRGSEDGKSEREDGLYDENDDGSHSGGMSGMGNAVSVMVSPTLDEDELRTVHGLALSNDAEGLVTYLQDTPNANINSVDEYGYTPLHLASDRGNTAVVQVLLENGADPQLKDPDNLTALELAHIAGHEDIKNVFGKVS